MAAIKIAMKTTLSPKLYQMRFRTDRHSLNMSFHSGRASVPIFCPNKDAVPGFCNFSLRVINYRSYRCEYSAFAGELQGGLKMVISSLEGLEEL